MSLSRSFRGWNNGIAFRLYYIPDSRNNSEEGTAWE